MPRRPYFPGRRRNNSGARPNTHADALVLAINILKNEIVDVESLEHLFSLLSSDRAKALIKQYADPIERRRRVSWRFTDILDELPAKQVAELGKSLLELLEQELLACQKKRGRQILNEKLGRLQQELSLSAAETRLIHLLYVRENRDEIDEMISHQMNYRHQDFSQIASVATGLPETEIQTALQPGSNLSQLELLDQSRQGMGLSSELEDYLADPGEDSFASSFCIYDDCQSAFPLSSFVSPGQLQQEYFQSNLAKNKKIFLVGKPGVGKTAFAQALVKAMGRQAIVVSHGQDGESADLHKNLLISCHLAAQKKAVVIFDECELFLTRSYKTLSNRLLETLEVPVIFISNEADRIHPAVLSRFDYLCSFGELSAGQRFEWFRKAIEKHDYAKHLSDALLKQVASHPELQIRDLVMQLDNVVKTFGNKKKQSEYIVEQRLVEHLNMRLQTMGLELLKPDRAEGEVLYSPAVLNVSFGARHHYQQIENMVKNFSASKHKNGLRMVFHGLPGSGKSNFASYLAEISGRKLLVKRYSDLSSKWVGDTEKLIARAFAEAEAEGSILLLDEADSLLSSRDAHHNSWETSMINEVLSCMENFKGILICTTNRFDHLDAAVMRRFQVKAEFSPLLPENRIRLFELFFSSVSFGKQARARLGKLDGLMPGDFAVVRDNWAFGDMKETAEEIVEDLAREVAFRQQNDNRMIGF